MAHHWHSDHNKHRPWVSVTSNKWGLQFTVLIRNVTIIKTQLNLNPYGTSIQTMKKWKQLVVLEYLRLHILLVVIYYYLERRYYKVLKFDVIISSYFEISASLFFASSHLKALKMKCQGRLLEEIRYATKSVVYIFCSNVVQHSNMKILKCVLNINHHENTYNIYSLFFEINHKLNCTISFRPLS